MDPCTSSVMPNVSKCCPRSSESATRRSRGTFTCACPGNGRSACTVVCQVTHCVGAVINFETTHAIFGNLEPETVAQLERSPTGLLWMGLFEEMPVVRDDPLSLSGPVKSRADVGLMTRNSKAHVSVDHHNSCTDSQRTSPSRQTHETDLHVTMTMLRSTGNPENTVSLMSPFDLKKSGTIISGDDIPANCSHFARRSDETSGSAGMGTRCERGTHASRKEEHLARTRGEGDEVRD